MAWLTNTKTGKPFNTDWLAAEERMKYAQIEANQVQKQQLNSQYAGMDRAAAIRKAFDVDDSHYSRSGDYMVDYKIYRDSWDAVDKARQRMSEIDMELKYESERKPREEWDEEDEFQSLMGNRPMTYTEKGLKLKAERDALYDQYRKDSDRRDRYSEKLSEYKKKYAPIEKEEYLKRKKGVTPAQEGEYTGFRRDTTGVTDFDENIKNGKGYIVEMSPREYLDRVTYDVFNSDYYHSTRNLAEADAEGIGKLMDLMTSGTKMYMPYLDEENASQEGRHRAMAAEMLGISKIPVLYVPKRRYY